MNARILSHVSTGITASAVLMAGASIISRVLGLVRDRLLAHAFGAGEILDAYYAAFKIPDALFNLIILGTLSAGFIPVFTKFRNNHPLHDAWPIVHSLLGFIGTALVIGAAILYVFAPNLMHIIAPGFSTDTLDAAISFSRIMCLSPLLLGASAIFGGALQSLRQFFIFSLAPILYNIGIIIGVLVLYPFLGISGLAWGVVLGAFMHMTIQYAALRGQGFFLRFSFRFLPEVRRIFVLMAPRSLGLAISQISLIILTAIASTLETGSVAAFQLAYNIAFVPIGTFAISYAVAAFPAFSESALERDSDRFISSFSSTVRQILFLLIPSTVLFVILRAQIVRVLLGTGAFDWQDTVMTFDALAMLAIGFVGLGLVHVLMRAFYAFEDTHTPVFVAIIAETVTVLIAYIASRSLGVAGIAMGVSVGALLHVSLLWLLLLFKIKRLDGSRIITSVFKMTIAALCMAVITQWLKMPVAAMVDMTTGVGVFVQASVVGILGAGVYIAIGLFLKTHEMNVFVAAVRDRLIKTKSLPSDISDAGRVQ